MGKHRLGLPDGYRIGQYEFCGQLGSGGFAITYLANDSRRRRRVAIKELLPTSIATRSDGGYVEPHSESQNEAWNWAQRRFTEEADTVAACKHPNVLEVYETFRANGTVYMVSRYEEGCNLEDWLEQHRTVNEAELRAILIPLLSALEQVHNRGFLHRDIKPQNIFITRDGRPILIDFGSARQIVTSHSKPLTTILTPGYAPFEQYSSEGSQGPWTDLYALGAVMYRAISGSPPPDAGRRAFEKKYSSIRLDAYHDRFSSSFLKRIEAALVMEERQRTQSAAVWRAQLQQGGLPQPTDLHVVVSQSLRQQGNAVHCTVPVDPAMARNGGDLAFPLAGGRAVVRIPPNAQNGIVLRGAATELRGGSKGRRELVATVLVKPGGGFRTREEQLKSALLSMVAPGIGCTKLFPLLTCLVLLATTAAAYGKAFLLGISHPASAAALLVGIALHLSSAIAAYFDTKARPKAPVLPNSARQWIGFGAVLCSLGIVIGTGERAGALKVVDGIRFRWCPPGSFIFSVPESSQGPFQEVTITDGFWIAEAELTRAQWTKVMGGRGRNEPLSADYPMVDVSWDDAMAWCRAQNTRINVAPWRFDLPTEIQWEYACRAQMQHSQPSSPQKYVDSDFKKYPDQKASADQTDVRDRMNAWGICDMLGNVWEWCKDTAPGLGGFGVQRVCRGGSYADGRELCQPTSRYQDAPDQHMETLGFRPVLTRGPELE